MASLDDLILNYSSLKYWAKQFDSFANVEKL